MSLEKLKEDVIEACLKMQEYGLVVGAWGNISARDVESGKIVITPSGIEYDELEIEDMVVVNENGEILEGHRKPTSETAMHTVIYRKRPEVNSVVHTHSPYATAMSVADEEIPVVVTEVANMIGGIVPISPYTTPGTEELGSIALDVMENRMAALLKNHGVLALGDSVKSALNISAIVEDSSKVYYLAKTMGNCDLVPKEEIKELRELFIEHYGQ